MFLSSKLSVFEVDVIININYLLSDALASFVLYLYDCEAIKECKEIIYCNPSATSAIGNRFCLDKRLRS